MKELTIMEASKMPENTRFNLEYENGEIEDRVVESIKATSPINHTVLIWESNGNQIGTTTKILNAKFIPIQKPVTFMEALKAYTQGKQIKCIYENISSKKLESIFNSKYSDNIYFRIEDIKGCGITPNEILHGEWYIEE